MGLSSTKTKTTNKETATTTPNPYAPALPAIEGYYGNLAELMGRDSSAFAPQTNPLLNQATTGASNLGQNNGALNSAADFSWALANQLRNQEQPGTATAGLTKANMPGPLGSVDVAGVAGPEAAQAQLGSYGPLAFAGDASGGAGSTPLSYGGASGLGGIQGYMNPQLEGYIKAALGNFDEQAGKERAAYSARGAKNNNYGGSGYYLGEADLLSNLTRDRAMTEGQLGYDAWKTAADFSSRDADRANAAGIASMQSGNQFNTSMADRLAQLGMFNAGAVNDRSESIFDATNQNSQFNTGQQNDILSQIFGEQSANARQNASSANDANQLAYTTGAETDRFNAGSANDLSQFNAGQQNTMASSNANRQQQGYGMALDGAGQYADIQNTMGDNARDDIGVQAQLGQYLSQLQQQQALAPYTQAGVMGDLLNPQLLGLLTGQTVNASSEGTSKQSGGIGSTLLGGLFGLGSAYLGK